MKEPPQDIALLARFDRDYKDPVIRNAMKAIYLSRRGQGDSELAAEIYALRCHVDPTHPSLTPLKP